MNNSRFSVYRGDFRKSIKAFEFTHVGVFMRTRRADSHFAASRISCRYQAGNAGASDLVSMPAVRDLGSLHSSPLMGKGISPLIQKKKKKYTFWSIING
jgi:hypothetical protein